MGIRVVIEICAVLILIGFWTQNRKRIRQQVGLVNQRLLHLESSLGEFMKECERTFSEFALQIRPAEPSDLARGLGRQTKEQIVASKRLRPREASARPRLEVESPPDSESHQNRGQGRWKAENILQLAGEGNGSREIAARLGVPQGEIELVLNLNTARASKTKRTAEAS